MSRSVRVDERRDHGTLELCFRVQEVIRDAQPPRDLGAGRGLAEQQLPKRSAPSIGSRHGDTLSVTPNRLVAPLHEQGSGDGGVDTSTHPDDDSIGHAQSRTQATPPAARAAGRGVRDLDAPASLTPCDSDLRQQMALERTFQVRSAAAADWPLNQTALLNAFLRSSGLTMSGRGSDRGVSTVRWRQAGKGAPGRAPWSGARAQVVLDGFRKSKEADRVGDRADPFRSAGPVHPGSR